MKYWRIKFLNSALILLSVTIFIGCNKAEYRMIDGFTQGTTYHIAHSDDKGVALDSLVEGILKNIDLSLSVYNKESLITKINNGEDLEVDSLFRNVFNRSYEIYKISGGLFDVSAAPLFNIWGFGFKNKMSITKERVDSAMQLTGMDKISIENSKVIRTISNITLNFNAIAQGYTADVIASEFEKLGIINYLIEVGGEIFCKGVNPKGKKWSVGIDRPVDGSMIQGEDLQDILLLSGGGLATSGNYRKFYEEDGQKYSHTINPLTGYPAKENILSATVTAPDAMTADAYATWFMVAGVEKAIEIIESDPTIEGYLVYSQGEAVKVYKSTGIKIR
ncbi:MAG: thiamine biosynthesis protein ApbE [Bacteroidetes bacterium HGW-Bacteroidetes-8]|jgi:thiamine biosynthesis lipoprotein|nr:MAG: thiamine biosynthesis protein ApbE [Bacteroidetes bacterium HGW-Bacteroidetes-8]